VFDTVLRRARVVEALLKARLEVDVAGLVAGARARLESRLPLEPTPVPGDLADKRGPLGWGRVRTQVWQTPKLRKIALSHVDVKPMVEGFALAIIPHPRLDAPVFGADLMALPTRVSVNADVYGPRDGTAKDRVRDILQPLGESFVRLGTGAGPAWAQPISSGVGLHAKVSPRVVDDAFAALTAALARYLDVVDAAPSKPGGDALAAASGRDFFAAFHENGPRRGPVGKLFGADWAERYSHLFFE
jgi:hypothetical protein